MIAFASLVVRETKAAILGKFLLIAQAVGLPVTSWEIGDPTDTLFQACTDVLDGLEGVVNAWVRASFLDTCAADTTLYSWLVWLAYQGSGYTAREASYAATTVTLTNGGGGTWDLDANDLSFRDSSTGATFRNTSAGTLASGVGETLVLDVIADLPGSASTSGAGDIDELVTPLTLVTCASNAAAIGLDAETAASIVTGCRAKLAMMSPNGARDAYRYVSTASTLTGTTAVTLARSSGDSTTGRVGIKVAGPNMPISAGDVALVQAAIDVLCTPLCITPIVASASALSVDVTYQAWGYASWGVTAAEAATLIETALLAWFTERPIGGDVIPPATDGVIEVNMIEATIKGTNPSKITKVTVTLPVAGVAVAYDEKPVCGTITASSPFTFIPDP